MNSTEHKDDILQQIKQLKLMDDVLMVKCFENSPECTDLLLQLILKKPVLQSKKVTAQWQEQSIGLDILATDSGGQHYKVKVFRDDTADKKRRSGLELYRTEYAATQNGIDHKVVAHFVIYIVEHGATRKPIDRGGIILDGGGEHNHWGFMTTAFYVNCDRKNRSPLGKLMYDFSCTDPSFMNYPLLADRVRYFKENSQGIRDICEMLEQKKQRTQSCEAPKDK